MNAARGASVRCARALFAALVQAGLRDVVLCPGSRSAPMAYAVWEIEKVGAVRVHVRHDERSAAFLALGLGMAASRPAVVLTTSGTAVANLHPAVMEASHAGVPLIALSADRPVWMRGTWANQTSEYQPSMFGAAVRLSMEQPAPTSGDAEEAATWAHVGGTAYAAALGACGGRPGPVHLDLAFDDPLVPHDSDDAPNWLDALEMPSATTDAGAAHDSASPPGTGREIIGGSQRTVVIAGDRAGPVAARLAGEAGWPLLAEPSSRTGARGVPSYRLLLQAGLNQDVERIVAVGHPTLSRPVTRLFAMESVEVVHVVEHADDPGPGRDYRQILAAEVGVERDCGDPTWLRRWNGAGRAAAHAVDTVLDDFPDAGTYAMRTALQGISPGDALMIGASNPVRDLDLLAHNLPDGVAVYANRGLAGIDGTIATAAGVNLVTGRRTHVLLGDLSFLHDVGSLVIPQQERERLNLAVTVFNDDGGGIFTVLEHGARRESFERVFGTPHGVDLQAVGNAVANSGISVRQIRTSRARLRELTQALTRGVAEAAAPWLD